MITPQRTLIALGTAGTITAVTALPAAATGVPPITCETSTACVMNFVSNNGHGYWTARRWNGTLQVRLTMVAGWDNTQAAPITCLVEDSCVISYYSRDFHWMARQASQPNGPWVRLTKYVITKL